VTHRPGRYRLAEPVILASASPRRRKLLAELVPVFRVAPSEIEETLDPSSAAEDQAVALAVKKARKAAERFSCGTVIAADTLVHVEGVGLVGKPSSPDEAVSILSRVSGKRHKVVTGVCVLDLQSEKELTGVEATWVKMRPMSPRKVREYVASGEAMGKAGAYAIQETGDRFVESVEGSLSNVVGLPLELLDRMLRRMSGTG